MRTVVAEAPWRTPRAALIVAVIFIVPRSGPWRWAAGAGRRHRAVAVKHARLPVVEV